MLTWTEVCARRLDRQGLREPAQNAGDAARRMCGVHAQVPTASEISLGLRLDGATRTDVRTAIWDDRTIVRTFGPRGTVHLLAAADLPGWIGALSDVPAVGSFAPDVRLDAAQVDAVVAAAADALDDAELTLPELDDAIEQRCGAWAGEKVMPAFQTLWPRWRQAMSTCAHRGALCFGPPRGRTLTYASPRQWHPDPRPSDGGPAWLLREYLHSYGPATPEHFARWLSAPVTWARAVFDERGDAIEPVEGDGWTGWVNAGDTAAVDHDPPALLLLPYFDAHVVGCHPRDLLFPGRAAERALARTQAGNFPTLLLDGIVAGVWHSARKGKRMLVTVEPLKPLSRRRLALLEAEVERVGAIAEARPELTIGTITVGPHA